MFRNMQLGSTRRVVVLPTRLRSVLLPNQRRTCAAGAAHRTRQGVGRKRSAVAGSSEPGTPHPSIYGPAVSSFRVAPRADSWAYLSFPDCSAQGISVVLFQPEEDLGQCSNQGSRPSDGLSESGASFLAGFVLVNVCRLEKTAVLVACNDESETVRKGDWVFAPIL